MWRYENPRRKIIAYNLKVVTSRERARFSKDIYSIQYCYGPKMPSTLIFP
jgi:hypothetical protein